MLTGSLDSYTMLTSFHKADVCLVLARLLSPPDQELIDALSGGEVYEILNSYFSNGKINPDLSPFKAKNSEGFTRERLMSLYHKCFDRPGADNLFLVESIYKPWTMDTGCSLVMAKQKGFLMGDSALHMLELYQYFGLQLPEDFNCQPDHLVLELEFLSFLYENYSIKETNQFINDHLDWIVDLIEKSQEFDVPDFYITTLNAVNSFILRESYHE
jgi:TorA maturation chaperone TorD